MANKHNKDKHSSVIVYIKNGADMDDLNKALSIFNRRVDDAGILEDVERTSRHTRKGIVERRKRLNRLKNIAMIERKRNELRAENEKYSVVK